MRRPLLSAKLVHGAVIIEKTKDNKDTAELLVSKNHLGKMNKTRVTLSLIEALYLVEDEKLVVSDYTNRTLSVPAFMKRALRSDKRFVERYTVFRDLRNKGYFLIPALKYGADFAVYDKGSLPGHDHSRWLLFVAKEHSTFSWREWVAKNRVAHSVKKSIMIGIVDADEDVTYYESAWIRP